MKKLVKKDCEKIYISKEHYKALEFLITEHFNELNRQSLKEKNYNSEEIMKSWIEDYIDKLFKEYDS